jgi:type I restriction enzyme S subunit
MSTDKNKLIPELRFPEFVKDGEWVAKSLGRICDVRDGTHDSPKYIPDGFPLITSKNLLENGEMDFDNVNFLSREDYDKINQRSKVDVDDILFGMIGTIGNPVIVKREGFAIKNVALIKSKGELNQGFLIQLMKSEYIAQQFQKANAGGILKFIALGMIRKLHIPTPSPQEQQKIASCLSSLDEVIATHSQKLATLKDHKKGLMQNLFPTNSITNDELEITNVPNYRFPEFLEDGEWVEKKFSSYIKLYRGSSPRPIQEYLTQNMSGVNWIKIGDTKNAVNSIIYKVGEKITFKGAEKSRKVEVGELILANSMSYGKTYELAIEGCIYDGWFVLRKYEEYFYKPFLLQLLNSEYMQKQYKSLSAGGIVQNISSEIVYQTNLFHTSPQEQQKIASCLSSLDDLITAQAEKIAQLKLHKKGLMEGLFPRSITN